MILDRIQMALDDTNAIAYCFETLKGLIVFIWLVSEVSWDNVGWFKLIRRERFDIAVYSLCNSVGARLFLTESMRRNTYSVVARSLKTNG